jgi:N-sulfoglucosamine sulfohydrolase
MTLPNILYLHSHDTGRYIQPYGYGVPTPNLQRLAEQGVLFRQAFCAAPTCSPSRAALLTGAAPHSNGMFGLAHFGFRLNDYEQHILHTLQTAGYTSILAGIQHIDGHPEPGKPRGHRIGFDTILEGGKDGVEQRAADFLASKPQQPFFLDVGFEETHRVFPEPGPEENPSYQRPPAPLPDSPETRRDMAGFVRVAKILDQKMGQVLDALEANGLAENTLVICTTDHGLAFPAMKCNLTDHGTGVMLMMRGPGGFTGGKVVDALVSHVDLFPTLCDLLKINRPSWLQGVSLLPLVRGGEEVREAVFSEVTFHVSYDPQRSARTQRWKYIRRFDGRSRPVLPNCDDSLSKSLWMEHDWRERTLDEEQLYDLMFDPNEANNLAYDPTYAEILEGMQSRLEAWMAETNDPLLQGPIEWPGGITGLDPDKTSPQELGI